MRCRIKPVSRKTAPADSNIEQSQLNSRHLNWKKRRTLRVYWGFYGEDCAMFKSWIEIHAWPWHGGLKNKQAKWLPLFKLSTLRPGWFIHLAWNLAKINERKSFFVSLSSSFPLFFSFFLPLLLFIFSFFSFLFFPIWISRQERYEDTWKNPSSREIPAGSHERAKEQSEWLQVTKSI